MEHKDTNQIHKFAIISDTDPAANPFCRPGIGWLDAGYRLRIRNPGNNGWEDAAVAPGTSWALYFDGTKKHHVYHDVFWKPGTAYGNFGADFLIVPMGTGYVTSAGYGGAHCLLAGVTGNEADGYTVTGNVYSSDTGIATTFTTTHKLRHGKLAHVGIYYDGALITCVINGRPCSYVSYTGNRKTANDYDGTLLIGGSDHINFTGYILQVRLFEGAIPYANPHLTTIRPPLEPRTHFNIGSTEIEASFLADYRTGNLEDISGGLSGKKHNGILAEANGGITGLGGQYGLLPLGYNRSPSLRPTWAVIKSEFSGGASPKAVPVGARIYDSFGRDDVHFGNNAVLGLGGTQVGGKVWTNSIYGISNGSAFVSAHGAGELQHAGILTDNQTDGTIILRRPVGAMPAGLGAHYGVIVRAVDGNTFNRVTVDEYGQLNVHQFVAGVNTGHLGTDMIPTNWTEIKVVLNGTQIQTYTDGTLRQTKNQTQNLTGTGKTFYLDTPMLEVSEFEVR